MTTTTELQKQLKEALEPLKDHPEANNLISYLDNYDIFSSFLPYEKDLARMSEEEKEQQKYYKAFWAITELLTEDPSILHDEKNSALMQMRFLCYAKSPQLHALVESLEETEELNKHAAPAQSPAKGHF